MVGVTWPSHVPKLVTCAPHRPPLPHRMTRTPAPFRLRRYPLLAHPPWPEGLPPTLPLHRQQVPAVLINKTSAVFGRTVANAKAIQPL